MTPPDETSRRKILADAFRMPSVQTMVSRKSSITNAFVNAVIPIRMPTLEEIEKALAILGMDPTDVRCAYCGDRMTEWDHLRPLVKKSRPTGFITEIANLVPSCGKCNQSKGNTDWAKWMLSQTAKHSPTKRGIADVAARVARLEDYEKWLTPTMIDFEAVLGIDEWGNYWKLWDAINVELRKCQDAANLLRKKVAQTIGLT
jgi:hypothetical protein